MRVKAVLVSVALVAGALAVTVPTTPVEAAAPAGCRLASNGYVELCDQVGGVAGTRGSIGMLGDSVMLGSATGMSTPSLPTMLVSAGWGPIRLTASLGMATYWSTTSKRDVSAFHWIDRWKAAGFSPDVIAVNIGANEGCASVASCKARMDLLLDEIKVQYPKATVWWAKIVHTYLTTPSPPYMNTWNAALDAEAAARPNMVLWDWPSALATASPPISMDLGSIHPRTPAGYVTRSTMMAAHINRYRAYYAGPRVALPAASTPSLYFSPAPAATVYDTTTDLVRGAFTAEETREIDLSGAPGVAAGATALALTVTTRNTAATGFLTLYPCDTRPATSNVNDAPGRVRTAQVLTRVTAGQHVCVYSQSATDVSIGIQGSFVAAAADSLVPVTPTRVVDTRPTGRQHLVAIDLAAKGVPTTHVDAVAVNLTSVGGSAGGTLTAFPCDQTQPEVPNVTFAPNETMAGAAYVPISATKTLCVAVDTGDTNYTNVIIDVTGVFTSDAGLTFVPVTATRLLDTRSGIGGWYSRQAHLQVLDIPAAPAGASAVSGTVTMVRPLTTGFLTAYQCDTPVPVTSVANATAGNVAANTATVAVDTVGHAVCLYSWGNTDTLFDVVGWWIGAS